MLYISNRGHNSIGVMRIDQATGLLKLIRNVSTEGEAPRHFTQSPTGNWILIAN